MNLKELCAGDAAALLGPIFVASPFSDSARKARW
jgi:hypothetical protein